MIVDVSKATVILSTQNVVKLLKSKVSCFYYEAVNAAENISKGSTIQTIDGEGKDAHQRGL
jgi:hypothetical protein